MLSTQDDKTSNETEVIERRVGNLIPTRAPLISVVIPAFDASTFIKETLESVIAQTFKDYEIIVVNDGSRDTEELEKVLEPYQEVIVYVRQVNGGASSARNTAVGAARGDFLAFLDADDVWFPDYLQNQIEFLDTNKLDMVYCDALLFGDIADGDETFMQQAGSVGEVSTESLLSWRCNIITSGSIVKTRLIREAGLFDLHLRAYQDFDMWFNLAHRGARIGYRTDVLLKYRVRADGISGGNVSRAERNIASLETVADKYELTVKEQQILRDQLTLARAFLALEKSKAFVLSKDYRSARIHLKEANLFYRKPKLSLVISLLWICPGLVLRLYKLLQPSQINFYGTAK